MDQTDRVGTNISEIQSEFVQDENNLTKRARIKSGLKKSKSAKRATASESTDVEQKVSKKPKNTALKQQRLPAWQPILTAKTVFPLFFGIGVVFVTLGGILLHFSNIVNELVIDYTDCESLVGNGKCSVNSNLSVSCYCEQTFTLDTKFEAPVYLYYGLKNFYQNHRRYVKSRDDNQLLGNKPTSLKSECKPYDYYSFTNNSVTYTNSSSYAPCGAIANSLFSDKFVLKKDGVDVSVIATGIAWNTDKTVKFRNPTGDNPWENTIKPKNWRVPVQDLSSDPDNTGYINEDLIVWMRTAALPTFRKLYRRVNHSVTGFEDGLPAGNYSVYIDYSFPVTDFNGRKSFIISTTTWIGGKNPFLGIAYLVVGCLCIFLGIAFLLIHFKFAKNIKDEDLNSKEIIEQSSSDVRI